MGIHWAGWFGLVSRVMAFGQEQKSRQTTRFHFIPTSSSWPFRAHCWMRLSCLTSSPGELNATVTGIFLSQN